MSRLILQVEQKICKTNYQYTHKYIVSFSNINCSEGEYVFQSFLLNFCVRVFSDIFFTLNSLPETYSINGSNAYFSVSAFSPETRSLFWSVHSSIFFI